MAFTVEPHVAATFRISFAVLLHVIAAIGSSGARAQTCVGTDDIVCTNSGTVALLGDPPSGPVSGNTNFTNINTATGTAGGIRTAADHGNAATINYGTANGNVTSVTGELTVDTRSTATVTNYGTINGIVRAITQYSDNAVIVNSGFARALVTTINSSFWARPEFTTPA